MLKNSRNFSGNLGDYQEFSRILGNSKEFSSKVTREFSRIPDEP
jgi:hypothetical protein